MSIETLDELEKLHATFVRTIAKQIDAANVERPRDPKVMIAEKTELLSQMRQQLADTTTARDLAQREYDKDIQAQERAIQNLEDEIKQTKSAGSRKAAAAKGRKPM